MNFVPIFQTGIEQASGSVCISTLFCFQAGSYDELWGPFSSLQSFSQCALISTWLNSNIALSGSYAVKKLCYIWIIHKQQTHIQIKT